MKRGSTNTQLVAAIAACRKTRKPFWVAVARLLERPNRRRVQVNLREINTHANDGETVVVPGRVLGVGELTKRVTVAGYWFSRSAAQKLGKNGVPLADVLAKHTDGKGLRIMA